MIRSLRAKAQKIFSAENDFYSVLVSATFSTGIKILAVLATFLMNFVFSRYLGASEVGKFFLVFSVINIVATIGKFGFDRTVLRFVAAYASKNEWGNVKAVQSFSFYIVLSFTFLLSLFLYVFAAPFATHILHHTELTELVKIFSIAIVPLALIQNTCEALKGLHKIQLGLFLYNTALPFLATILFLVFAAKDSFIAVVVYLIACAVVFIATFISWKYFMRQHAEKKEKVNTKEIFNSSLPMFANSIFTQTISWLPSFMLGLWCTTADVGLFEIAKLAALSISFFLGVFYNTLAPRISALYANNEMKKIENICTKTTLLIAVLSLPVYAAISLFSSFFMHFFGDSFGDASLLLKIIAAGQIFNVITGPVGLVLIMCGREKKLRNSNLVAAIVLLVLNIVLIPFFGATGAAISFAAILILQNLIASIYVWREFKIVVFPFIRGRFIQ